MTRALAPGDGDRRPVHPSRIPPSCPLPREPLKAFLASEDAEPGERACDTCAFARRLTVLMNGARVEFTACHAPERERPALVYVDDHRLVGSRTSRPVIDEHVLSAVRSGIRSVPLIAGAVGCSERAVWAAARRLKATGALSPDLRLGRYLPELVRPGHRGPDPRGLLTEILAAVADGLTDPQAIAARVRCHPETVRRQLARLRRSHLGGVRLRGPDGRWLSTGEGVRRPS